MWSNIRTGCSACVKYLGDTQIWLYVALINLLWLTLLWAGGLKQTLCRSPFLQQVLGDSLILYECVFTSPVFQETTAGLQLSNKLEARQLSQASAQYKTCCALGQERRRFTFPHTEEGPELGFSTSYVFLTNGPEGSCQCRKWNTKDFIPKPTSGCLLQKLVSFSWRVLECDEEKRKTCCSSELPSE